MRNKHGKPVGKKTDPTVSAAGGLTDMARERDDRDDLTQPSGPDYSHGLRIHLDHGDLEKLGHHDHPHEAGSEVHIHAKGRVAEARSEDRDGKREQHLSVQLTHIGIHHPADGFEAEDQKAKPARKRH